MDNDNDRVPRATARRPGADHDATDERKPIIMFMPTVRSFSRLAMLMLLAMTFSGCQQFAAISETMFMMSTTQELELGQEVIQQLNAEMQYVNDPVVVSYIQDLGRKLWAYSPQGPVEPRFHVIRNDELNAFAVPGGDIFVHTGLIDAAEDEAELAGVIAHELGHVIRRHGAQHVSHQMGLEFVQQLVLGEDSGQVAQLVTQLLAAGVMTNYSREDEQEADDIAVRTLYAAGYDPMAMHSFFQKLVQQYGEQTGVVSTLFASHPPTTARMEYVQQLVRQLPNKAYQRPTQRLREIQERI